MTPIILPRLSRARRRREERLFLDGTVLAPFSEAKRDIRSADLLLYRKNGLISVAGRGIHSHAAKAAWWDNDLFCLEVREFHGGRAVTLESQVERWPGRIDVFRANADDRWPEYDRRGAVAVMRRFAGCDYGYWNVFKTALTHVPVLRFLCRPAVNHDQDELWSSALLDFDPNASEQPFTLPCWCENSDEFRTLLEQNRSKPKRPAPSPPYCSEACSLADRLGGGVNPVELLSDRFTEPADLARSPFYRYLFTLA